MNQTWREFLTQNGAHIEVDTVTHFDTVAEEIKLAAQGTIITDLSHLGVIKAEGTEAQTFLHNQFTNDLKLVTAQHSQLSAYCSPKGRILTLFRVFMRGDCYYLAMPRDLLEATLKRLRMFVLRSKVTLNDAGDEMARFGLAGPQAESLLKAQFGTVPAQVDEAAQAGEVTLLRIPGPHARYELHGPAADLIPLWQAMTATIRPVGISAWRWLDIQAGVPSIFPQTIEAFIPQMVNLQAINGLSFKKGCYPGQEIVARTQYLGKLKRRMFRISAVTDRLPLPGDPILINEDNGERKAGEIVVAVPAATTGLEALAVIESEASDKPLFLFPGQDSPVQITELPYQL